MAFIEYLLFKYGKTLKELFDARPNEALVKKLEAAIAQYKAVLQARRDKEARIAELEAVVKAGGKVRREIVVMCVVLLAWDCRRPCFLKKTNEN